MKKLTIILILVVIVIIIGLKTSSSAKQNSNLEKYVISEEQQIAARNRILSEFGF